MTVSEVRFQSNLMSAQDAQLLLPKLTDEQLVTLRSYGATEQTSVGQVLATAGDLTYDLMVVLEGEVECSDIHDGRRRALLVHRSRDFIAELDLLTGQRVYVTFVVTEAGSIIRVPRSAVKDIIETDAALGELLVQTLFRRREALLLLRSGMQLIGSRYSPDTQRLREFAARNRLAFTWIDLDSDPVAPALLRTLQIEPRDTPVAVLGGSAVLVNPSNAELATAVGITEEPLSGRLFDCSSLAPDPPASRRLSTERPRGSRRRSSMRWPLAGRSRRRRASRTTSGSPRGSRAPSSASAPSSRRSDWEPRCSCPMRSSRSRTATATTT
jgi:CRP-like cAMP-binding protein